MGIIKTFGLFVLVVAAITLYLLGAAWLAKKLGHDPSEPAVALVIFGIPSLLGVIFLV